MTTSRAFLSLVLAMTLTGANVPLGKIVVDHIPVLTLMAFRFILATVVLAALQRRESGPSLASMTGRDWVTVAVLGLVGSVLFTLFILEGARRTSGADAGIVTATVPVVVAIAGVLLKGERLSWRQGAMVGLASLGIGLLQATGGGTSTMIGLALVFLAVLCEAAFVVASRRISATYGPIRLSFAVSALSLVASLPLLAFAPPFAPLADVPLLIWAGAVWYALTASALCTILWYRGAAHVPTWMAGLATAALPVSALVVSATLAGETIGWHRLTGAALVIGAILLAALAPEPRDGGKATGNRS